MGIWESLAIDIKPAAVAKLKAKVKGQEHKEKVKQLFKDHGMMQLWTESVMHGVDDVFWEALSDKIDAEVESCSEEEAKPAPTPSLLDKSLVVEDHSGMMF